MIVRLLNLELNEREMRDENKFVDENIINWRKYK